MLPSKIKKELFFWKVLFPLIFVFIVIDIITFYIAQIGSLFDYLAILIPVSMALIIWLLTGYYTYREKLEGRMYRYSGLLKSLKIELSDNHAKLMQIKSEISKGGLIYENFDFDVLDTFLVDESVFDFLDYKPLIALRSYRTAFKKFIPVLGEKFNQCQYLIGDGSQVAIDKQAHINDSLKKIENLLNIQIKISYIVQERSEFLNKVFVKPDSIQIDGDDILEKLKKIPELTVGDLQKDLNEISLMPEDEKERLGQEFWNNYLGLNNKK